MVDAADALVGFDEGDILKLQLDTRTDTVDGGGRPLASTKSVLTVFKNGLEQTGYENVPARARAPPLRALLSPSHMPAGPVLSPPRGPPRGT